MTDDLNLSGDRPLGSDDPDYLGVVAMANWLAAVLQDRSLKDGFVIGIEGRWGSGKSSLIKKTIGQLGATSNAPVIIQFNPWLVGDKRNLVAEFFVGLDEALEKYHARKGLKRDAKQAAKSAKEKLQKYSKHLSAGAQFLSAASLIVPQLKVIAEMLERSAPSIEGALAPGSLHEQKLEIEEALRQLPDPIIVFMDDTERLDPSEVMEILRLLRAVGDLPNVVYVVCYDRQALVRNIGLALRAESVDEAGEAYLEKIVQATLSIPKPEDFALRRWFLRDVLSISGPQSDESLDRLRFVVDTEGGQLLETPRDVVRALNSLKLVWPAVRDFVDLSDLVWLHLTKLKRPALFEWIERYLNGFAEVARGTASASDGFKEAERLLRIIKPYYSGDDLEFYRFNDIIPGLSKTEREKGVRAWTAFQIDKSKIDELTQRRRLGSPHYYRYYFSLGQNSGFLPAETITSAKGELKACAEDFLGRLSEAAVQRFDDGELHFPILIDSLKPEIVDLDEKQSRFFFDALSNESELAIRNTPDPFHSGRRSVWATMGAIKTIIRGDRSRRQWLIDLVDRGRALSFTAFLIRNIQQDGRHELGLDEQNVQDLVNRFCERVSLLREEVFDFALPDLILRVVLRNDKQSDESKNRLQELLARDESIIRLIGSEDSRSVHQSSGQTRRPLYLNAYAELLGETQIEERVSKIINERERFPQDLQLNIDTIVAGLSDAAALKRSSEDY